ncbi:MAG: c-type cytochrome [Roseovarius sp.]
MNRPRLRVILVFVIAVTGVIAWNRWGDRDATTIPGAGLPDLSPQLAPAPMVAVAIPASFSATEAAGERAFATLCAVCHGENAAGRNTIAPPLVHRLYHPGHHGDAAFQIAVQNGVRAHHWRFGNMPPIAGVTRAEVETIIAYVRALQRANGIE